MADIWEGLARDGKSGQADLACRSDRPTWACHISGLDAQILWAAAIRAKFDEVAKQPLPSKCRDLLKELEDVDSRGRANGSKRFNS
jgi:hypothetical protein